MAARQYHRNVFINCPFDDGYYPLFRAIVFSVYSLGFLPRSALEVADSSQFRLQKIIDIIRDCRFGIHDISRMEVDTVSQLPRFNMPLELGLFLGAKHFGSGNHARKNALVLDVDRFRYQKFISDISGQDISAHGSHCDQVIRSVRDWLNSNVTDSLPGASRIIAKHHSFISALPQLCTKLDCAESDITFPDLVAIIREWLIDSAE